MKQKTFLPWFYLGLGFAQTAHSVEEVLTGLWKNLTLFTTALHTQLGFFPVLKTSGDLFAAANLILVALLLGFSPAPFINHTWAWKAAKIIGFIEVINGFYHLTVSIVIGRYFSGCISAFALITFGILVLLHRKGIHEH